MSNELQVTENKTPIEVLLAVDENGKTSAKNIYKFLELSPANYTQWVRINIVDNEFAEENEDYSLSTMNNPGRGRPTQDYKLTASFAKKLCMRSGTVRGEQARDYFVKVEETLKQVITQVPNTVEDMMIYQLQELKSVKSELSDIRQQTAVNDTKLSEVLDKVTINSRQKVKLINHMKNRLTVLTGEVVNADHYKFRVIKQQLFKEYQVRKWEELTVSQFDYIFADIDSLDDVV